MASARLREQQLPRHMSKVEVLKRKYYPDEFADGTLIFYSWLRQHARPHDVVLNVGAGPSADSKARSLKGEVKQVVGVDIDEVVLQNADLDQAFVIQNGKLPFPDGYFDLAWADYVLEHVQEPKIFLKEIHRVLKADAWFFFRTPNKRHYVSLIGRMTPHRFHELCANRVRGLPPGTHDPYPTYYLLNDRRTIEKTAFSCGFSKTELKFVEAEPSYLVFHPLPFLLGVSYERFVNRFELLAGLRANIFGKLQK